MADRILLRRAEAETKTVSGFFIPEMSVEKTNKGTVIAMGPGKLSKDGQVIPIADIAVNNTVMFSNGAGIPVTVNGEEFLVLKEEEILAVVSE